MVPRPQLGQELCQVPGEHPLGWHCGRRTLRDWGSCGHPFQAGGSDCTGQTVTPLAMLLLSSTVGLAGLLLWVSQTADALMMPNATVVLARLEGTAVRPQRGLEMFWYPRKHHISALDIVTLLDYHNHIRASVYPPAANMEYMVSPHACPCAPPPASKQPPAHCRLEPLAWKSWPICQAGPTGQSLSTRGLCRGQECVCPFPRLGN